MDLTEDDLFEIANEKSKKESIQLIRTKITNPSMNTESDLWRVEIECELALELIQHGLHKGFDLNDLLIFVSIQKQLVDSLRSHSSDLSLAQFTKIFYDCLNCLPKNAVKSETSLKQFIDYEGETILKNFNLLSFVFQHERDSAVQTEMRQVLGPTEQDYEQVRLRDAKHYDEFVKEQKIAQVAEKQKQLEENYVKDEKLLIDEEKSVRNLLDYIKNDAYGNDKPLDEEAIHKLIEEISEPILNVADKMVQLESSFMREKSKLIREIHELKLEDRDSPQRKANVSSKSPKAKKK